MLWWCRSLLLESPCALAAIRCIRRFIALVNIWLIVLNLCGLWSPLRNSKVVRQFQRVNDAIGTLYPAASNFKIAVISILSLSLHFDLVDDLQDSELVSKLCPYHINSGLTRVSAACSCVVAMDQRRSRRIPALTPDH